MKFLLTLLLLHLSNPSLGYYCSDLYRSEVKPNIFKTKNGQTRIRWSADLVVKAVQALHKEELELHWRAVRRGGRAYEKVLLEVIGIPVTGVKLVSAVPERGWTWETALKRAGLEVSEHIHQRHVWTVEEVIKGIQALHKNDLAINLKAVEKGGEVYEAVLSKVLNFPVTGNKLLRAKPEPGWNWDKAIERAGFKLTDHKKMTFYKWTPEAVVQCIHALSEANLALNFVAVRDGGMVYNNIIAKTLGQEVTGGALIQATPEPNWNWNVALVRAGIDPNEVRLRGSAPFQLLTQAMQDKLSSRYEALTSRTAIQGNGKLGEVEGVVVVDKTAEDIYREIEVSEKFNRKMASKSEREQYIFEKLLEYFESGKDLDFTEIELFFKENTYDITQLELTEFLTKIKSDESLKELLLLN